MSKQKKVRDYVGHMHIYIIISAIMGDILMAVMDPRISYTSKAR